MNRYKLNQGDIIKIGRITLRIRDIKLTTNNLNISALNDSNNSNTIIKEMNNLKTEGVGINIINIQTSKKKDNNKHKNVGVKEKIKPISLVKNLKKNESIILTKILKKNNVCRICYMEEEEENDNPLLQPCICSGSMKYIHLSCLKHWISTRNYEKIDKNENCSIFLIKSVECELCKTKFPDFIKHKGKLYALLDFSQEYNNYLTLECLTLDKNKKRFIYVISLIKNRKMKMGRGRECDITLNDLSVSRVHCHLIVDNKKVYLEDNESKFGSLILIQYSNIKVIEGIPLNIQVGRTYIECKIKKPFNLFNCCDVEERTNLLFYYNQNEKEIQKHISLVVRIDYNEEYEDDENENNFKINNTFEKKYLINMNEKYSYNSMEIKDKDKISDNEYFALKYHKLNKNKTRVLIDEDDNNKEDLINNDKKEGCKKKEKNISKNKDESIEENIDEINKNDKINNTENDNNKIIDNEGYNNSDNQGRE